MGSDVRRGLSIECAHNHTHARKTKESTSIHNAKKKDFQFRNFLFDTSSYSCFTDRLIWYSTALVLSTQRVLYKEAASTI